ncbi:transposase [Ruegeria faecimaris]|uniref:Transposase n=1 Tax=Ruegeria faecimaris TaxID=686389 RepID=A0A521F306_9RHOB|nr:Transposase [Ruegeria faecimaris]
MARKRYSDEDILKLLREIELKLADGDDVRTACRGVGVSDATYYNWRRPLVFEERNRVAIGITLLEIGFIKPRESHSCQHNLLPRSTKIQPRSFISSGRYLPSGKPAFRKAST